MNNKTLNNLFIAGMFKVILIFGGIIIEDDVTSRTCPKFEEGCIVVFTGEKIVKLNQDQSIGYKMAEENFYKCINKAYNVDDLTFCQFGSKHRP